NLRDGEDVGRLDDVVGQRHLAQFLGQRAVVLGCTAATATGTTTGTAAVTAVSAGTTLRCAVTGTDKGAVGNVAAGELNRDTAGIEAPRGQHHPAGEQVALAVGLTHRPTPRLRTETCGHGQNATPRGVPEKDRVIPLKIGIPAANLQI